MFSHGVLLPSTAERLSVRAGTVGDELFVLVGDAVAVFVVPDVSPSTHVEVRVVESATGRLLFERSVRYRLEPCRHHRLCSIAGGSVTWPRAPWHSELKPQWVGDATGKSFRIS
jgi:hypothetical protein